jgi:hypothetical protein
MNEWTSGNTGSGATAKGRGQANDPHLNVAASYFTLQPVTPSGTDPVQLRHGVQVQRAADRQLAWITSWRSS